jgi:hypothetical protein
MVDDNENDDREPCISSPPESVTHQPQSTSNPNSSEDYSSSDEEDEEERIKRIYKENEKRRQERKRRNQNRMVSLGLISSPLKSETSPTSTHSTPNGPCDNELDPVPNGMLLLPPCTALCQGNSSETVDEIDDIYKRFPHREVPIKTLMSLIGVAMGQTECQGDDPFVPPPIFVSGPSGSGKTSIVRDVVETLQQHYAARLNPAEARVIGTAYVNCAAIEPSSLEAVLESAYSQLMPAESSRITKREKKKKRKKDFPNEEEPKAKGAWSLCLF